MYQVINVKEQVQYFLDGMPRPMIIRRTKQPPWPIIIHKIGVSLDVCSDKSSKVAIVVHMNYII